MSHHSVVRHGHRAVRHFARSTNLGITINDHDSNQFSRWTEVVSAKESPWQNPYAERVIGSIRRECTDHVIPLDESHLRKILREYVAYYNTKRCHQSLDGNAPEPRQAHDGDGSVYAIPHLGGLHRGYRRAG